MVIVIILGIIIGLAFFNERTFKMTYEIFLLLFSVILGGVLLVADMLITGESLATLLTNLYTINLEKFLLHGVLCFMLFAGSCHMKLSDFRDMARQVTVLSIVATLLGAIFYGVLFYGISCLLGLSFSFPMCLMFGSIVSPTDPIAATSILNKFGLPRKTGFLIEGESLLNDGVGVALYVCFSGIVKASDSGNFFEVMAREIFGAAAVGIGITLVCFLLFSHVNDKKIQIYISLFAVAFAYMLCDMWDFSGAIASVVCGVLFSNLIVRAKDRGKNWDLQQYDTFWEILDHLLNSVLYVILGLTFIRVLQMPMVIILCVLAIVGNLIARAGSLGISTLIMGPIPDGFSKIGFTKLLTWGGLRGGLCIALAMSTQSFLSNDVYVIVLGCTYAIAFFTTVVQGLTMRKVYKRIVTKEGLNPET